MTLSENKSFTDKGIYLKILCMSSIFTKSFLILLKAVKAARGGKYVHRELIGTVTDKKGKIRNKWKYFYNQGTLQQELAAWKAGFERKQAKQKRNLFATPADIKGVSNVDKILAEHPNLRTATITPKVRHTIQDVTPEGYGPDELPKQTSVATPQPTSPKVEPVQTVSFDDHIASQNLTPKQLEVSKQVYNTVKDLPESELRVRLDRLSKLPASNGIAGITAINYVLGLTRSEAMVGNQNAKKDVVAEPQVEFDSSMYREPLDVMRWRNSIREGENILRTDKKMSEGQKDALKRSIQNTKDKVNEFAKQNPKLNITPYTESTPQENNFQTMPESEPVTPSPKPINSALPQDSKVEANGFVYTVKSSITSPKTNTIIYTVEDQDGVTDYFPENKIKILPVTTTPEIKKTIESADVSNRMAIEKQLIGKPENVTSIKDDIAEKSKAPIAYIEKEITTLSGIKIKAIDYSSVPINEIQIIDAENILTTPKPSYIPEINERDFEIKSYFLEFVKAPDGNFIVPLNWYVPKVQNKAREQEPKYAIMSLENIVATTEYYRTKKLEEGRDKATKNNIANVEKILTWDQKTREYYKPFNYTRLSESQKKKYSEEAWNKLSETEKLKEVPKMKNPPIHINPIPRLKIGLKEMSMLVSTFHLYNELVDSSYSIPSRAAGYNPKDQVAIDFNSIREDYKQKVEDMKIQKEEDSASYKQALETSFGMSKTKNDLFESHGILVKSQNGKEVNRDQVKDISEAMNLVYSVFGDKKQLSQSANLKISHSGEKYIFASKALGMYVRSMGTIAISNKDSKVSKGFTLAHEFAHFMDNWLGKKNKRNFASDDYNSVAGKIAKTFREKMENLDIATGYHKRTCECFARALEQYFAIKTGNDSEYSNQKYYIKDTKYFEETFSPMIEKFLSENEHLLKAFPLFTERKSNILTLLKGKKAQEGEVRTWGNNKQYKKVGGKWQPVNEGKKKAEPKQKKEKKKGSAESNTGFSMKPFAEIKRIAQYTKEADFDKEKIEQYKNSIAEHGYDPAFPMVIDKDKKTGAYNVVAGNHRYKAVEALISEGKLPKDFEIPTVMREFEDENARLAYQVRENQRRDPLPTDEANAYKKMADNGWDAARIAKELGQPVGKITKRLALSNLSPDLFNLVSKKGIPVGIAEAIGLGSVEEESGKPNHTIQLKAYQFYRDNKGKGYGAGEVLSFIRELKSNASQKFFENDGKSDTEKEALRSVGSEEKAKRNVKMLDTTFKTMQKALSQLMGDSVGQINPKLAKELSASIVAAQGESEFSNKMKMLDTVIQDMTLMKEAFMKSFKGMKDDSTMGMMFASSINTMIHHVNKHTKAIETAKAINKMLSMAYKAKYKLHDQSVKARLAA